MKLINIPIIFCALIFSVTTGCKKDTVSEENDKVVSSAEIRHTWELRYQEGGYGPQRSLNYLRGNGNIWKFTDITFEVYYASQLSDYGAYKMIREMDPATGQLMDAAVFSSNKNYNDTIFIRITADTLTMFPPFTVADGTIRKYVRLKE